MTNQDYCECADCKSVHADTDDFGYWLVCDTCGKVVEDSYEGNEADTDVY